MKTTRQRFSDAALSYGALADVQAEVVGSLRDKLPDVKHQRILDVGAGNGALAAALVVAGAEVVALDAAWGMVKAGRGRATGALWVQADACALPFAQESFDQVVSSSAYQWVEELPVAFAEVKRVLKGTGCLTAAMFGRRTLDEFFVSMQRAGQLVERPLPEFKRLADVKDVRAALQKAGFRDIRISVENKITSFKDVKAILGWLQGIGANAMAGRFFWGKALLAATEQEYRSGFAQEDGLRATFEVIWIEATV